MASVVWGALADWLGLRPVLLAAAVLLAVGALTVVRWPLRDVSGLDREPAVYWPEPYLEIDPEQEDGPVLVNVTYSVATEKVPRFLQAMVPVRRLKMRTGATSYSVPPSHGMMVGWCTEGREAHGRDGEEREDHHQRGVGRPRPD